MTWQFHLDNPVKQKKQVNMLARELPDGIFNVPVANYTVINAHFVDDAGIAEWLVRLRNQRELRVDEIGASRDGRPLHGFTVGSGRHTCTITAGAHADEPAGPVTAMVFAQWLAGNSPAAVQLRSRATFRICPQVNPDGAQRNSPWFAPVPQLTDYLEHVFREQPGDDVEFGYPGGGKGPLRPENKAVADFLDGAGAPVFHASLHSMAYASGAWFLLGGPASADRHLQLELARVAFKHGLGLHDIERNGDKGFTRLALGFCTTPDSRAMAAHFLQLGDPATADKFHFSSMEYTALKNPDAYLMVTELPVFLLKSNPALEAGAPIEAALAAPAPQPGETPYERFRDELRTHLGAGDRAHACRLAREYGAEALPFSRQCSVMVEALLLAIDAAISAASATESKP